MTIVSNPPVVGLPVWYIKASDETISNSSVYQDDNELVNVTMAANILYDIEITIIATCTVTDTEDFKFNVPISAGTATWWGQVTYNSVALAGMTTQPVSGSTYSNIDVANSPGSYSIVKLRATVKTTSAATLKIQWAQINAAATNCTVKAGSYIKISVAQ